MNGYLFKFQLQERHLAFTFYKLQPAKRNGMIIETKGRKPTTPMLLTHLDQSEIDFLQQIKKELSLETNDEVIKRVASILQALRQTLTREDANELVNQLPDFLKLAFIGNWDKDEAIMPVNHLDELVTLIQNRDIKSGKNYFTSEVQILSITILTLKKLLQFNDLKNFKGLSPYITQQLNEISAEEIAA